MEKLNYKIFFRDLIKSFRLKGFFRRFTPKLKFGAIRIGKSSLYFFKEDNWSSLCPVLANISGNSFFKQNSVTCRKLSIEDTSRTASIS